MKKIILGILCLVGSYSFSHAQNVDYTAWIYQFTSWEGGVGGACWESGTEEYTRNGWIRDNQFTTEAAVTCQQCNNNGNCTSTGTWATRSRNNAAVTEVRVRIDAWEDDGGSRCSHGSAWNYGDDCRTTGSTWTTLNPVEYQNTTNNWSTGNGNHRAYARVNYIYSSVNLNAATENTAVTYTTGGNRPFWGSRGSWSDVGGDCATSGTITDNQTSSFSTTVSCQQSVTFRWRVSSEANWDYLEFYINGVRQNRISGTTGWATQTYTLPQGQTSTLEWRYDKDGSVFFGEDRGFVDDVQFTTESRSMNAGTVTNSQTVCSGVAASTLSSTTSAVALSPNYQWQISTNNSTWSNIGGATGLNYTPSAQTATRYYRRRVQDACGRTAYSNTITIGVHPSLAAGAISGVQTICAGSSPSTLNSSANATGGNGFNYQWQQSLNGTTWANIGAATGATYNPAALTQTTYYRRRAISNCGEILYSNTILITVNTQSTAPTPAAVAITCPNTDVVLSASGGIAGTGSSIEWYSDAAGTLPVGTGSPTVTATQTTTYYVRREGTCNSTGLQPLVVNVRDYIYTAIGNSTTTNFCDDNAGWRHFYNASDEIILSVQGDFSGISSMEAVVSNNGTFFQETENAPTVTAASCSSNITPGEERFELPRSWNINYSGTLNGSYQVRYYFPAAEKTALETAANNYIVAWPDCGYTYKYPYPNGFYWFKNTGSAYTAPQFEGTFLAGAPGSVNGTNYSEMSGITSFSGGTGAIILTPSSSLPIELLSFDGENKGNYNLLRWATATELNNDYFELERTTNPAEGFDVIARIDGAGTSSEIINYEHLDENPAIGTNYYRLKQTDFDGTTSYSEVIALEVEADEMSNALFPNPTKGKVFYRVNASADESVSLKVVNALGQKISEQVYQLNSGQNQLTIDLSEYPSASYWIQLFGEDGQLIRTEIVNKVD